MIPLRISLEGFISYREKQCLDFSEASLWMLEGSNGVGKSTIFDAITYVLFNKHRSSHNNDLLNHDSQALCVEFDVQLSTMIYRIRRTLSQNGGSTRGIFELAIKDANNNEQYSITLVPETDTEDGFNDWIKRNIGFTYRTFTSSILLLQGKSEQLLNATPKDRYIVLAELIDLSRYQQLYEHADKKRAVQKLEFDKLEAQLRELPIVGDEQIASQQQELRQKDDEWSTTYSNLETLHGLLERVKQRTQLVRQREAAQKRLPDLLELLRRESEITTGYHEWRDLSQVLTSLRHIVEQRIQLDQTICQITSLQQEVLTLETEHQRFTSAHNEAELQVRDSNQQIDQLQQQTTALLRKQTELAPLANSLNQIEQLQQTLQDKQNRLAQLPEDIERQLHDIEQRSIIIEESSNALPWLNVIAQTRQNLHQLLDQKQQAQQQAQTYHTQLQHLCQQANLLLAMDRKLQPETERLAEMKTHALHDLESTKHRLHQFTNIATQPTCDLCGQVITSEHVRDENMRLNQLVIEQQAQFEQCNEQYQTIANEWSRTRQDLAETQKQIQDLRLRLQRTEDEARNVHTNITSTLQQLRDAYSTLPSSFQSHIAPVSPTEAAGWLETTYPTSADITTLLPLKEEQQNHRLKAKRVRTAYEEWKDACSAINVLEGQLQQLSAGIDREQAQSARQTLSQVRAKEKSIEADLQRAKDMLACEEKQLQHITDELKQGEKRLQNKQNELSAEQRSKEEKQHILQVLIDALPGDWQDQAPSLDTQALQNLESRQNELSRYDNLYQQLLNAHQAKQECERTIASLSQQIDEDFQDTEEYTETAVEEHVQELRVALRALDQQRNALRANLAVAEKQREMRINLLQKKGDVERQLRIYKILSDLLGRNKLQRALLSDAESTIVFYANRILQNLSHGRLRLELRKDGSAPSRTRDQALDLMVFDNETGKQAIPVSWVSGSQRFRIAVSLALAIGRFTRGNGSGVEAVIIDEGFGGLDKTGRDDMIQELNTLGQQLARIILVSHQEEFANAFKKRYSFDIVNGATQVQLQTDD